jgi:hypothetical protein
MFKVGDMQVPFTECSITGAALSAVHVHRHWSQDCTAPFLQVTEAYDFRRTASVMRRDLRSGKATASARSTQTGVMINARWSDPLAGGVSQATATVGAPAQG